jgi:hypothetical protein
MAKRSDFAQKLLDDLRLRKERMAATTTTSHSHNSNQSRHLPIGNNIFTFYSFIASFMNMSTLFLLCFSILYYGIKTYGLGCS